MYGGGPAGMGGSASGQAIFTDDVSLQVFMEHLKRLVSCPLDPRFKVTNYCVGCWRSNYLIYVKKCMRIVKWIIFEHEFA